MLLLRRIPSAVRAVLCGLLVVSSAEAAWAGAERHDGCDMRQAGGAEHHCGRTTRLQACNCGHGVDATPAPAAKTGSVDAPVGEAAIVRVTHPSAPTLRLAVVVPSRGLLHASIPILHAALLL